MRAKRCWWTSPTYTTIGNRNHKLGQRQLVVSSRNFNPTAKLALFGEFFDDLVGNIQVAVHFLYVVKIFQFFQHS